jgi:hypothetical protein
VAWIRLRDLQQHHARHGADVVETQSDHIARLRPSWILQFVATRSPATSRRLLAHFIYEFYPSHLLEKGLKYD